jgi:hypothetical protein
VIYFPPGFEEVLDIVFNRGLREVADVTKYSRRGRGLGGIGGLEGLEGGGHAAV